MSAARQQLDEQLDCHQVALAAIVDIFRAFDNKLAENELATLEVPTAVALAMAKMGALVELSTLQYDGVSAADVPFEKMDADLEPVPTAIDSWARGAVATRKVVPDVEGFHKALPDGTHSNTPSVSSYRSSALTGRSKTTAGTKSRGGTALSKTSEQQNDKTGQIFDLDEDDLDKEFGGTRGGLSGTGFMFESLQKAKKKKDPDYFFQAQDGEEKGEFDLLAEQITRAAKDMRGKAFVLDRYGQPVPVGKVNTDHLPPFAVSPASSIVESGAQTDALGRRDRDIKDKDKDKKVIRVAGSRGIEFSGGFEPNLSLAVTLGNISMIDKVNPGVTIVSSQQRKAGDAYPEDPKHPSKKVYFSQTNLSPQPSVGQDAFQSADGLGGGRSMASEFSEGIALQPSASTSASRIKGRKPVGGTMRINSDSVHSLDSLPEVDRMAGAQPLRFAEDTRSSPGNERADCPGTVSSPQRLPQKPSTVQKRSIALLRGGQGDKGILRDRDLPQNVRNLADRKHLPAPPLGFTTGHGLDKQRALDVLSAGSADSEGSAWHQQWRN